MANRGPNEHNKIVTHKSCAHKTGPNGAGAGRRFAQPGRTCSDRPHQRGGWLLLGLLSVLFTLAACTPAPAPLPEKPRINSVAPNTDRVARYGKLELTVELTATYENPYDVRQVDLTATFTGPNNQSWIVPGFWDAKEHWRVRFSPPVDGDWHYQVRVQDPTGASEPQEGQFTVLPSQEPGWLQVANRVDATYSPRYLAHHDGTPFFGVGHADAFDLMAYGFDPERGFALFDTMAANGENMLVYWAIHSNPFFNTRYDRYSAADLQVIDLVVDDAAAKGIYLVFTIWDHNFLRDASHPWGDGLWNTQNGFRALGDLSSFFTDDEMWAWQANLYRYIIARWGYSPAIGLWQTISEIDGTNAGPLADDWHRRVNAYFAEHDPYHHPITASKAGDIWWPAGFETMDVLQVHSYQSQADPVGTGPVLASWTAAMWNAAAKPNFVGEFGTSDPRNHPELLHNGIWAALANGAAATPMEWNDSSTWGKMTEEMLAQMSHLSSFVADLPLAWLDPAPLVVSASEPELAAWGIGGNAWGIVWIQDVSLAGRSIDNVRAGRIPRSGAQVIIRGLSPGDYRIRPYDTWRGVYLEETEHSTTDGQMAISLPEFIGDIAVKLEQK